MPPQIDKNDTSEDDAVPSSSSMNANDNNSGPAQNSYWEAPKETELEGKTLSTLDMTTLESNHPEEQKKKKDDYWEATPETSLQGKTLSTLDMTLLANPEDRPALSEARSGSTKSVITAEEPDLEPSYWDAPKEKSLKGKTLSTLDITTLETNHPEEQLKKQDVYWGESPKTESALQGKTLSTLDMTTLEANHPDERQEKTDSYWGDAPKETTLKGKTLSTLEISALETNHPDEKKEKNDSYWEAPVEKKLAGKTLSTIDITTLEITVEPPKVTAEEASGEASYWDDAPIDKSLEGKRLSSIDLSAMNKQRVDEKTKPAHPYWDWQGPMNKIKKSLSRLSMSNLRKGSGHDEVMMDDDCVHGGSEGMKGSRDSSTSLSSSASSGSVKPITNKKHKLRDTWRKSFHRLSTNTLDQLDESNRSGGSGTRLLGKRIFKSRNSLDVSGGSHASIGEDAIMF